MRTIWSWFLLAGIGCSSAGKLDAQTESTASARSSTPDVVVAHPASTERPAAQPPVEVVALDPAQKPPTFVLRGRSRQPIAFLAGLCGHAQYYVQSFQESGSRLGTIVAPQGEILCGAGPYSTLSGDIKKLNQRIVDAFAALAIPEVRDVVVIGYSLGASHTLALARQYPERYTRLVLIAAPTAPTPWGLKGVKRTVMLAGSRDRKDLMRRGVTLMQQANLPSKFLELPGAYHGQMGDDAERVMAEALRFVLE